jgi:predicted ATP-grasp superfamily ATP-dependent carboligase
MSPDRVVDSSVPAVVLKLVPDPYAHGRLAAVRSLGRLGVSVHHLDETPTTPAGRTRFGTRVPWTMESTPTDVTLQRLLDLGDRIGDRPVLIATDDVGALFVDEWARELEDRFRFPRQPEALATRLADKAELYRLCRSVDVPTPECVFPQARADVEQFVDEGATFPVVMKSGDPRLLRERPNASSVTIADTPDELLACYDVMEDPAAPNLLLQEYIPGGPETVWMFNGYFDASSECHFACCGRKLRQRPPETGATTLGRCEENAEVDHLARRFLKEVGYCGIVDMGFRYDARDHAYKLLDVNPRLGSTFRLFADDDGMDVVRALYLDATGQRVPEPRFGADRRWIVEPFDVWSAGSSMMARRLSLGAWARSLRHVDEVAWFAVDDLRPFVAMAAAFTTDSVRSARRHRHRGRAPEAPPAS